MAAMVPATPIRFSPFSRRSLGGGETLLEVGEDVVDVLDAHGEPHEPRGDTGSDAVLLGSLRVRRRGRVDHERTHVTDVRDVAVQGEGLDELLARVESARDLEGEHRAGAAGRVLL